jgi:hypothetical protein
MSATPPTTLPALVEACRRRDDNRPAWAEVTDESARLRVGAAYTDAVTTAGLLGDTTYLAHTDSWPADVNDTLEHLGLFKTYSPTTLHGVLKHLSPHGITGLVNNVKGVDLEIQTVERINSGGLHLPGVDHAQQAQALNQPGWDLQTSSGGHVVGHLQVKATDDWHVLAHHLARYPQYQDIVTNHEAIAAAAQHGMDTSHLIDAGSNAALTDHVTDALQHVNDAHVLHELVPEFAVVAILAIAAAKLKNGADRKETGRWAREQLTTAGVANVISLLVQIGTGTVALRPVAAMGTRFAIAGGRLAGRFGERARARRARLRALPVVVVPAPSMS